MQRKAILIGALLAIPLLIGGSVAAFAAGDSTGSTVETGFMSDLAKNLGISQSTLTNAVKQSAEDEVQSLLSQGKITQQQATNLDQQIQSGKFNLNVPLNIRPQVQGKLPVRNASMLQAAATYLGLTQQQLLSDLKAGKTLASLIPSGKSVSDLESAMIAGMQNQLQAAVTSGKLTQAQESAMLTKLQAMVEQMVNNTPKLHQGPQANWGTSSSTQNP